MRNNMKTLLALSICVLALVGCKTTYDPKTPDMPAGFEQTDLTALGNERFQTSEPVMSWWKTLEDEQLDFLISWSLDHNKDVGIALANLQEARSYSREQRYDRLPIVTADGIYQRNYASKETGTPVTDRSSNSYSTGLSASWELDLFGRVSARIEGAQARERASVEDLRGAYVAVASEVAANYVALRGSQYRLGIAKRNAANQRETYDLTKRLTEGGRGTQLDVSRALTQLELTQSTIPAFEAAVTAYIHRLSVLTGQVPDTLREVLSEVKPMPSIPVVVNLGNVSDLLRRRPDIASAKHNLAAASADYDVASANQFPVVNIIGSLGFVATNLSSFGTSALAASVGPSVSWAAFDMGRVRAQIDQTDARAQRALILYEKAVLESLEDLQTAVSDFSKEEERRGYLQKAAYSSKESATLARQRYEAGVDTFLDVLNAEATLLEAEDGLAQSEISAALDLISVYKALGGGWQGR
jgi:multidrug efflux system outer membrane protein